MSSDCFDVRVRSVAGREVVFDVLTGLAGRVDDIATSRSFALVLLSDALERAGDEDIPQQERRRLAAKAESSALHAALAQADDDWFVSESWMGEHVAQFVKSCDLVERRNNLGREALEAREREIQQQFGGVLRNDRQREWQPLRWQRCHNFTLRVVVTEARWAEHLEPGLEFGTTAYDVLSD